MRVFPFLGLAGWLSACLGAGCGGGNATPSMASCQVTDPTPGAMVEIGTGEVGFEALVPAQALTIHTGFQGGYHVIAHARMSGLAPGDVSAPGADGNPETTFCAFREADGRPVHLVPVSYRIGYQADGDGFVLPSGRLLQLSNEDALGLVGERVVISVAVRDAAGASAWASQIVVGTDVPTDALVDAAGPGPADGAVAPSLDAPPI